MTELADTMTEGHRMIAFSSAEAIFAALDERWPGQPRKVADLAGAVAALADAKLEAARGYHMKQLELLGVGPAASGGAPSPPVPRTRVRTKPEAPASDDELRDLLLLEMRKGEALTRKALARRTGAAEERIVAVLKTTPGVSQNAALRWTVAT